jgi:hypothetical protein
MAVPLSPEEQAMIANYWGAPSAPAPNVPAPSAAAPRAMQDFARTTAPAPGSDDAIAAAYFAGQPKPLPAAPTMEATLAAMNGGAPAPVAAPQPVSALPPVEMTSPGNLFGQHAPKPTQAPGHEPPPPAVRQPQEFQREMTSGRPVGGPAPVAHRAAPANPDPWGIRSAQRGMVGAFDAREDAARRLSAAEQDKAVMVGDHTAELARRRTEDATIAQAEQQYAAEHFETQMTELQRQMDDVAAKKIDPKRLMKETPGLGFLAVIGGAIGGFYQGLSRSGENPFMKELNLMIDRDISAQEREIDQANKNVGQQAGLLAQQRALFQDTQAAKMAAKALYYQSAQDELMAEAARYDSPIYQARADDAVAQLEGAKQELLKNIGEANQRAAMAAAGQRYARDKEVQALYRDVYDKVLTATGGNTAMAEAEAKRQVAVVYFPGAAGERPAQQSSDPIALVPKDQRTEAVKEFQAHANKDKVIGSINKSFQTWRGTSTFSPRQLDSTRSAISGTIMANVPGVRSDVDFKEIVEPNLPARGDTEETLRMKEQTIRNFVESKTVTPILDAHAPGWRNPSIDEQRASFGARKVGQ